MRFLDANIFIYAYYGPEKTANPKRRSYERSSKKNSQ